jgi:proteasome lid subunit RPN8/RPN11
MNTWKIKEKTLLTIMELSKAAYPNEFSGMLVGDKDDKIINDIYIIPATINNYNSSTIRQDLIPMSFSVVGSVHSHPSPSSHPSQADLRFFQSKHLNIITRYPYNLQDFSAYNNKGEPISIEPIL